MSSDSYPDYIQSGPPVLPIDRIRLYSADEWEKFIEEWLSCLKISKGYTKIERLAGAGDMGRDVIANITESADWDNYQCKHYDKPLRPTDVWKEFGKVVYYTFIGEYTYPRKYYFIAPAGVGTSLSNLLKSEEKLKKGLIDNWEKYCLNGITSKLEVKLEGELKEHFDSLDFSIFDSFTPLEIIQEHRTSPYHVTRFGGGLPDRPAAPLPPENFLDEEAVYIKKLFAAYSEYLDRRIDQQGDIKNDNLNDHLVASRRDFFSAEALRLFSRDSLPEGEFERLKDEFLVGISDELREDYPDGYKRVRQVVKTARSLQISDHPLVSRLNQKDRGGICHQLANENEKVKWVNDAEK